MMRGIRATWITARFTTIAKPSASVTGLRWQATRDTNRGYGPAPRRVAACKYLLTYCLDAIVEGVLVEVDVPGERNAAGEVITPASKRWEKQKLRPIDFQRYANVGVSVIIQLGKLIDGIYKGAILPAELAEQAAEAATKDGKRNNSPLANLTRTQALAYFNNMLENTLKEAAEMGLMEKAEPLSAALLSLPSPDREIPAGVDDDDDFGEEEE